MAVHKFKRGLSLPISGEPEQTLGEASPPRRVALLADDTLGLKPTMAVEVGDEVERGQLLFEDKTTPGVRYTAPAGGRVVAIHRGAKRALRSVVIELGDDERAGKAASVKLSAHTGKEPAGLSGDQVAELLLESGLWTALRSRPFGRVADPATRPRSIFVTAADTNPLAPEVGVVLADRGDDFERGVVALSKLTEGPVHVCTGPGLEPRLPRDERVRHHVFAGPHPAGTVGLHIHTLDPVNRARWVWHAGYQDVVAIGRLVYGGEIAVERVVSLAGPAVTKPRLVRTRIGASLDELVEGELAAGEVRVISGSVFSGRRAMGEVEGFLGRYHHQVSVVHEGREREMLGWLGPGFSKFSVLPFFASKLVPGKKFPFTTSTHGSHRAIIPLGLYERVFPMDVMATFILRSIVMQDVERAEELGVLELDEEDLALCSFVDPGKHDFGAHLRKLPNTIEKEG